MFRPTTTKLVAMFVYGMLAPVGLFYILPIGGWSILLSFFSPVRLVESGRLLHALGLMASLLAMSYAVVSMVTYGIRNYMMRGLLFCAVWISLFAARILLSGVYKGPL